MKLREIAFKGAGYFDQVVRVTTVDMPRVEWFGKKYHEQAVLHVGCADSGFGLTDLHEALAKSVRKLGGVDPDVEALGKLAQKVPGDYFASVGVASCAETPWSVLLAPAVIEHVGDPNEFLWDLFAVPSAAEIMVTAPNCFIGGTRGFGLWDAISAAGIWRETVHPDHRRWYSPYTLLNEVRPFIKEEDDVEVFLLENGTQVGVAVRPQKR